MVSVLDDVQVDVLATGLAAGLGWPLGRYHLGNSDFLLLLFILSPQLPQLPLLQLLRQLGFHLGPHLLLLL